MRIINHFTIFTVSRSFSKQNLCLNQHLRHEILMKILNNLNDIIKTTAKLFQINSIKKNSRLGF